MLTDYKLNDCFIDTFGEIWYVKQLPDAKGYYLMGEAYNTKPDRQLSRAGLADLMRIGLLKFGWSAEDAKRWKE